MYDKNKYQENILNKESSLNSYNDQNFLICPNCLKNEARFYGFSKDIFSKPYYIYLNCQCMNNIIKQYELSSYINNILQNYAQANNKSKCPIHPNEDYIIYCESCKIKMCRKCEIYHNLKNPTHKFYFINEDQSSSSYCEIHKANHTHYCRDCNISTCLQCYLNNHLMHNTITKEKFFNTVKDNIPFKSITKLNEYFNNELEESSAFNDEIIKKIDLMIKGLINIKNSFIEIKDSKITNEFSKIIIANVIYKSFYNEKTHPSITSILNMEKLILNSLVFKDDRIFFYNLFNDCFKLLVEVGKNCNNLISRSLVSYEKNNTYDEKIINNTQESNQFFSNEEILIPNSIFSEEKDKKSFIDENYSSIKNSKMLLLSKKRDPSITEGCFSNEKNKIIELKEDNKMEKFDKSSKIININKKDKDIKKSISPLLNKQSDTNKNVYINYKKNIQERRDYFNFEPKIVNKLLKNTISSAEYETYLYADNRKPDLNKNINFKLGDIKNNKLFQKRIKISPNKDNIINNDIINSFNYNNNFFGNNNLNDLERILNSSIESNNIFGPNDRSFGFNNSFL